MMYLLDSAEYKNFSMYRDAFHELDEITKTLKDLYNEDKNNKECPMRDCGYCDKCPIQKASHSIRDCLAGNYIELPK